MYIKTQFGFRKGTGTSEVHFGIKFLGLNCRDVRKDMFLSSKVYEKAFNKWALTVMIAHNQDWTNLNTRLVLVNCAILLKR